MNFFLHIARPTRFPDSVNLGEASLLDHVYTKFTNNFTSAILYFPISDHLPIFVNMSIVPQTSKLHKVEFRDMSHCNKITFSDKLRNLQCDTLLVSNDINVNCNNFIDKIN